MASEVISPPEKVKANSPTATRDFNIGLRSGVLARKHHKAIGPALWTFAWAVDRQTSAEGWIHDGDVLTYAQVSDEAGVPAKTAKTHLDRLVEQKYLFREFVFAIGGCIGFRLRITAPKRTFRRGAPPSPPITVDPPPQTGTTSPNVWGDPPPLHGGVNKERLRGDSEDRKTREPGEPSAEAQEARKGIDRPTKTPSPLPPPKPSVWEKTPPSPESEWMERVVRVIREAADAAGITTTVGGWLAGEDGWVKYPKRRERLLRLRGVVRAEDWGPWMEAVARKIEAAVAAGTTYNGDWALDLLTQTVDVKWKRPQEGK